MGRPSTEFYPSCKKKNRQGAFPRQRAEHLQFSSRPLGSPARLCLGGELHGRGAPRPRSSLAEELPGRGSPWPWSSLAGERGGGGVAWPASPVNSYIYIYIYIERERERERGICSVYTCSNIFGNLIKLVLLLNMEAQTHKLLVVHS